LPGELRAWYGRMIPPALAAGLVALLARTTMPDGLAIAARVAWLAATLALAAAAALAAAPSVRRRLLTARRAVGVS